MIKSKAILGAAVLAAIPALTHAANIAFTYDLADLQYSTDGGNTFQQATNVGTALNPVINVPSGAIVLLGVDAAVTGLTNPAYGVGYDASKHNQPQNLGVLAFQLGLANSNAAVASVLDSGTGVSTASVNQNFTSVTAPGNLNNSGGIDATTGTAGSNVIAGQNESTSNPQNTAKLGYGANAAAELFNSLAIQTVTNGSAVFSLTSLDAAINFPQNVTTGTTLVAPTYTNRGYTAGVDTESALPTLTINVGTPEPTSLALLGLGGVGMISRRRKA